jgi:hypothetical protein
MGLQRSSLRYFLQKKGLVLLTLKFIFLFGRAPICENCFEKSANGIRKWGRAFATRSLLFAHSLKNLIYDCK